MPLPELVLVLVLLPVVVLGRPLLLPLPVPVPVLVLGGPVLVLVVVLGREGLLPALAVVSRLLPGVRVGGGLPPPSIGLAPSPLPNTAACALSLMQRYSTSLLTLSTGISCCWAKAASSVVEGLLPPPCTMAHRPFSCSALRRSRRFTVFSTSTCAFPLAFAVEEEEREASLRLPV